jgi:multidrug transporter EmrE-like cation transporter
MLGALIIFKEKANKYKLMGVALAISAVLLIALS